MPTRTWRGTIDSNWGTADNWAEGAVPTSADDVVFDASSPACTVNSTNRVCLSITFSAYTNTITMSNNITVGAATGTIFITLGASMGIAGSGQLGFSGQGNATLTTNGRTWPNQFNFLNANASNATITYTLNDNCTFGGLLSISGGATTGRTITFTSSAARTITCNAGITSATNANFRASGFTMTFKITSGTINLSAGIAHGITMDIDGGASTITFSAGSQYIGYATTTTTPSICTLKYTSGIVNTTGATLYGGTVRFEGLNDNVIFPAAELGASVSTVATNTINIPTGNWLKISGLYSAPSVSNVSTTFTGGGQIYCYSLTHTGLVSGAVTIIFYGTGTLTTTANRIAVTEVKFDTGAGGLTTLVGNNFFGASGSGATNFTVISGDVVSTGTVLFTAVTSSTTGVSSPTITANNTIFNNLDFGTGSSALQINITTNLLVNGRLSFGVNDVVNNVTLTVTSSSGININVQGSLLIGAGQNTFTITGNIRIKLIGRGTWSMASVAASTSFAALVEIDTPDTITISGTIQKSGNLIYTRGKVIAPTGSILRCTGAGFVNMHRIAFDTVTLTGNITMNEFFCGKPGRFCTVNTSTGSNLTVTFTDGFQKVARWIRPQNITITNRGQLTIMSRNGNRNSTNIGLLYFEGGVPFGIARNNPIVYQPSNCFGIGDSPADPNFI